MKSVGVIGGLGPETTARFYLDVCYSSFEKNKIARPLIVVASVPLPFAIEEDLIKENKGIERYIPYLVAEAQRLEKAGVDFIVIPCNSVHVFLKEVREAVHIPVLSIIEETISFIKEQGFHRVGIVSTSTTLKNRLYETVFEENQIDYAIPDDIQQTELGKFIHNLVMGTSSDEDREGLIKIISDFETKNVDAVALACTDLQLLAPEHPTLKIFDTMKILVDATVRELNS